MSNPFTPIVEAFPDHMSDVEFTDFLWVSHGDNGDPLVSVAFDFNVENTYEVIVYPDTDAAREGANPIFGVDYTDVNDVIAAIRAFLEIVWIG